MTRKDKMCEGYVLRTFHIPEDLDDRLRITAVKSRKKFSETVIQALKKYLK